MYVCVSLCVCVHVSVCVRVFVCVFVCVFVLCVCVLYDYMHAAHGDLASGHITWFHAERTWGLYRTALGSCCNDERGGGGGGNHIDVISCLSLVLILTQL